MKIGSIVMHCHDFDRTVAFWQAALHYVPREPAKDGWVVLRDPEDKIPICHSRVAIGVHAAGVGFISTSTPRTGKPKLSDWSLWERGDIPGGIVLKTTSLCLRTREAPSSSPSFIPTRKVMRLSSGVSVLRSIIPRWISTAQCTASTTLGNSASSPSPVFFTTRPWCSEIFGSTSSR